MRSKLPSRTTRLSALRASKSNNSLPTLSKVTWKHWRQVLILSLKVRTPNSPRSRLPTSDLVTTMPTSSSYLRREVLSSQQMVSRKLPTMSKKRFRKKLEQTRTILKYPSVHSSPSQMRQVKNLAWNTLPRKKRMMVLRILTILPLPF